MKLSILLIATLLASGCASEAKGPAAPADAAPSSADAGDGAASPVDLPPAGPGETSGPKTDARPTPDAAKKLPCVVNQHTVGDPACRYLNEIALEVVPRLQGTRDEKLTRAARVAWWSLKEGILSLKNAYVYSNCHFSTGDQTIGPLAICAAGQPWQVGISGSQVPGTSVATLEGLATKLFPGTTVQKVLEQAAQKAQLDAATTQKVVASTGTLRSSWLLRVGAIGFTNQAPIVTSECVTQSKSWCFGTGWAESKLYAPTKAAALQSMQDLKGFFDKLLP